MRLSLSWLTAWMSGMASVCLMTLWDSPVRILWSTFRQEDMISNTRMSAGALSPTGGGFSTGGVEILKAGKGGVGNGEGFSSWEPVGRARVSDWAPVGTWQSPYQWLSTSWQSPCQWLDRAAGTIVVNSANCAWKQWAAIWSHWYHQITIYRLYRQCSFSHISIIKS